MNMVNVCPDIPDDWRGGIAEVVRVLGVSRSTVIRKAQLGRRHGGLDWTPGKRGKTFTGKELKRFWREYR